jgi:hypothetical protein
MEQHSLTVNSLFTNLERVVCARSPRAGQAMLGARCSFALPRPGSGGELTEYSFPLGPEPFTETLARRTGLRITEHRGADAAGLHDHIARGETAVVVVDSFFLPYRPAFGRVHSHRTVIVRRGPGGGDVWVEDAWPPGYRGPLPRSDLDNARYSPVPLDREREPIYAGRAIAGEWFSVSVAPVVTGAPADWGAELLRTLYREATTTTEVAGYVFGVSVWRPFVHGLAEALAGPPAERFDRTRQASLLLRAEVSVRVYLCALLFAISGLLGDARLRQGAWEYQTGLQEMEMARDVLTKSLVHARPEYPPFILDRLAGALGDEERLIDCLDAYA